MSETFFDPNTQVDGFNITYGEVLGGDCTARMPAIYKLCLRRLPEGHDHYPETEEQYEKYGVHLPDEVEELRDIMVGCELYQKLIAAGLDIEECATCPLRAI